MPRPGCVGVEGRVLVRDDDLLVAQLRFGADATIDEHAGESDTIVVCLEGAGFTSVGAEVAPIGAGESVRWPQGVPHRLWTEGETMTTLMIER